MQRIYALDIAFDPKWFPPSTSFCKERAFHYRDCPNYWSFAPISQSDCQRMTNIGLTTTAKSVDARVNVVKLSDRGQQLIPTIKNQCHVTQAAEELEEMQYDLWKAIEEMEFCLKEKTFILV